MTDTDAAAKPGMTYQASGAGLSNIAMIVVTVCAVLAVIYLGWDLLQLSQSNRAITRLNGESAQLDSDIASANVWTNGTTVESRSSQLVSDAKTYQKLIDGKQIWSNLLPMLSGNTLQGVTLTGMNIDDKLVIKIDGTTSTQTSGTDVYSPYSMIARQVVAYRDAVFTPAASKTTAASTTPTTPTTPAKTNVFSDVTLTAISQRRSQTGDVSGVFSVTLTLNPLVLQPAGTK